MTEDKENCRVRPVDRVRTTISDRSESLSGGRCVLVVDDSATARASVAKTLQREGWEVIVACNGLEALNAVHRHRPAAVIVDVNMPALDGYQTCALIKSSNQHRSTPVIIMSSRMEVLDRARSQVAGADGWVQKPVHGQQVRPLLARCGCQRPGAPPDAGAHDGVAS